MTLMPQVTFVLSRSPIAATERARAEALAAERGVALAIADQTEARDWEDFALRHVELADALYFDMTREFAGFDTLLDAAMSVPLAVPGGRACQAEWPELDRKALHTVRKALLGGRAEEIAAAAVWLLGRAGRWRCHAVAAPTALALAE